MWLVCTVVWVGLFQKQLSDCVCVWYCLVGTDFTMEHRWPSSHCMYWTCMPSFPPPPPPPACVSHCVIPSLLPRPTDKEGTMKRWKRRLSESFLRLGEFSVHLLCLPLSLPLSLPFPSSPLHSPQLPIAAQTEHHLHGSPKGPSLWYVSWLSLCMYM